MDLEVQLKRILHAGDGYYEEISLYRNGNKRYWVYKKLSAVFSPIVREYDVFTYSSLDELEEDAPWSKECKPTWSQKPKVVETQVDFDPFSLSGDSALSATVDIAALAKDLPDVERLRDPERPREEEKPESPPAFGNTSRTI